MRHHLSTGRILKRDWPCFGLLIFITLFWLAAIAVFFIVAIQPVKSEDSRILALAFGLGAFAITVSCGPVIIWRVQLIRRVFSAGAEVQGFVLHIGENVEGIGHVVIGYRYEGRDYMVQNVTEGARGRGALRLDEPVDIMVDPGKPSRAFIARLYLE